MPNMPIKDLPKFLISNSRDNKREFIIHTQEPVMICEVTHLDGGVKDIKPVWAETIEVKDGDELRLAGLMRRMGDWYQSILIERKNDAEKS